MLFWQCRSGFQRTVGPASLAATGGLAIIGNPLMFANQDDLPLSHLSAAVPLGPTRLAFTAGGSWKTARNPARFETALSVEGHCPHLSGLSATAGLTPAAPDWAVTAWLGRGWGCGTDDASSAR